MSTTPMKKSSVSAALAEIIAAYNRPKKAHFTLRLSDRELAVLEETAQGRSASAALESIVSAYMQSTRRPQYREKSIKKGSFFISASLLDEVYLMAKETKTTTSEILHDALREAEATVPKG
jgi:hypothetical protein